MVRVDLPNEVKDESEAVKLMCHHLKMAAAYFEATYKDKDDTLFAMNRCSLNDYANAAARAFVEAIDKAYKES